MKQIIDLLPVGGLPSSHHQPGLNRSTARGDRMSGTAAQPVSTRPGWVDWLLKRQLDSYPDTRPRIMYLAITVLATMTLYYELYVGGSVSTLILNNLHMGFTFYVLTLAFGAIIGATGSLFAGFTDRFGRANMVVFGLLFTGIFTLWVLPAATDK